ncbi:MAG TPA: hypothetical protein VIM52_17790 [Stellaceae bacterium]
MRLMLAASGWMVLANPLPAFADGAMSAADWAIEKNQQLQSANFNLKCGPLRIEDDDVVWPDFCRTISGAELKTMILEDRAGPAGLRLRGVRILGKLDLSNAEIKHPVRIVESRIDGAIDLRDAHLAGSLVLDGTVVAGRFDGNNLRALGDLTMKSGASFRGPIVLRDARVAGKLDMELSTFEQYIDGAGLHVSDGLYMNYHSTFAGKIILDYARIGGNLHMEHSKFRKMITAEDLQVSQSMFIGASEFNSSIGLPFLTISGKLDLSAGKFTSIDLSGASIGRELQLCNLPDAVEWSPLDNPPAMVLRDARVLSLQNCSKSWPATLDLDGFHYDRLDVYDPNKPDPGAHSVEQWKEWLARNQYRGKPFNPEPYTYLAKVLAASGNRDDALDLQFAARDGERADAWETRNWVRWGWLCVLRWLCGYGIGLYTFIVILWVVGSVALGAAILVRAPAARAKGVPWCIGCSLEKLLPIIELSREFGDFLNDPKRERLRSWQIAFFSGFALWGWVLGLLLVAAMSGLTQTS